MTPDKEKDLDWETRREKLRRKQTVRIAIAACILVAIGGLILLLFLIRKQEARLNMLNSQSVSGAFGGLFMLISLVAWGPLWGVTSAVFSLCGARCAKEAEGCGYNKTHARVIRIAGDVIFAADIVLAVFPWLIAIIL